MTQRVRVGATLAVALWAGTSPAPTREAWAASAGSRGAVFLTLPPGPRSAGAAEALTAVGSDPGSAWINPAALARQAWPEVSAAHNLWIGDLGYQTLSYAQPVPRLGGAAAVHLLSLSKTGIPSYDVSGVRTGDVSVCVLGQ